MAETKVKNQKSKVKTEIKEKTTKPVVKKTTKKTELHAEVTHVSQVPVTEKPEKKATTVRRTDALHASVYDITGSVVESLALPEKIFGAKSNPRLIAQVVRVYLANQRAGSASTKSRGEVEGSTRKIYRQKGTGRARHGGVRAPIFVHGGIAHGPKPRDFSLHMPKKMKKAALFTVLSEKARNGSITVLSELEKIEPKTKVMAELLQKIQAEGKKSKVLLVLDTKYDNVIRAVRNIEGVTYDFARQLHAYEVLTHDVVIFMKNAISEMEKTFLSDKNKEQ